MLALRPPHFNSCPLCFLFCFCVTYFLVLVPALWSPHFSNYPLCFLFCFRMSCFLILMLALWSPHFNRRPLLTVSFAACFVRAFIVVVIIIIYKHWNVRSSTYKFDLTLKTRRKTTSENVVCLYCLLHLLVYFSKHFCIQANSVNPVYFQ